jgi:hypothetical protein
MKVVVNPKGKATAPVQQQPKVKKENRIQRFIEVIRKDIDNLLHKKKDEGWEDYEKYCELARGKK